MSISTKDFRAIATALHSVRPPTDAGVTFSLVQWERDCIAIADTLETLNPTSTVLNSSPPAKVANHPGLDHLAPSPLTRGLPMTAWTGGDYLYDETDVPLARQLYREQLQSFRDYWDCFPDKNTADIFKARARADAYATRRIARRAP